jgi:hypothetical protein
MKCPRKGSIRILQPVWYWDACDKRIRPWIGRTVRVMHPGHGCPPNGTMGHCYVEDVETRDFIGLVLVSSLQPQKASKT